MYKVNPVLYQNQTDKLPQIQQDYEDVKKHVDKDNKFSSNFDVIPEYIRAFRFCSSHRTHKTPCSI